MSIPLLFSRRGFHPRQLFAALQGAWLEPVQGSIWQENTGVTPTTTGGQTIGRIADQSGGGNNATQATAGNRPLLGRRYNLLTYSEDFSNAVWAKNGCTIVNNVFSATSSNAYVIQLTTIAITESRTITVTVKPGTASVVWLYSYSVSGYGVAYFDLSNLTTQAVSGASGSPSNLSIAALSHKYVISATWATADQLESYHGFGISDALGNLLVTSGKTAYLYAMDVRITSDVGKDPAYQRITTATDYDFGQYPAAVHDTTDSLVVSLPAINVRRNLLNYSNTAQTFTLQNATNASTSIATPFGSTARLLQTTTLFGEHNIYQPGLVTVSESRYTLSAILKRENASGYLACLWLYMGAGGAYATLNLDTGLIVSTGVVNASGTYVSSSVTSLSDGWYRLSVTGFGPYTNIIPAVDCRQLGTPAPGTNFTGNGTGFYFSALQLELGSTATDYQRVTDWTSEAYSSNGSVYFATPVGMSALHNQSMGTSYTLPALSTDIYSWIVLPQRLNAAQESRLARYMERRAGIAGPDYFEQMDYGPELVTDVNLATINDGLTRTVSLGNPINTGIILATNKLYLIIYKFVSTSGFYSFRYATTDQGQPIWFSGNTPQHATVIAKGATGSNVFTITDDNGTANGVLDYLSVRELKDGMTGQLTADDGEQLLLAQ